MYIFFVFFNSQINNGIPISQTFNGNKIDSRNWVEIVVRDWVKQNQFLVWVIGRFEKDSSTVVESWNNIL